MIILAVLKKRRAALIILTVVLFFLRIILSQSVKVLDNLPVVPIWVADSVWGLSVVIGWVLVVLLVVLFGGYIYHWITKLIKTLMDDAKTVKAEDGVGGGGFVNDSKVYKDDEVEWRTQMASVYATLVEVKSNTALSAKSLEEVHKQIGSLVDMITRMSNKVFKLNSQQETVTIALNAMRSDDIIDISGAKGQLENLHLKSLLNIPLGQWTPEYREGILSLLASYESELGGSQKHYKYMISNLLTDVDGLMAGIQMIERQKQLHEVGRPLFLAQQKLIEAGQTLGLEMVADSSPRELFAPNSEYLLTSGGK